MKRRAFTLIEILVVITILVILTTISAAAFYGLQLPPRVREAGRIAQAGILGARDRALHAKAPRGIRIVRDPNDANIGTGLVYLQRLDLVPYGPNVFSLERLDANGDGFSDAPEVVIVRGIPGIDWPQLVGMLPINPRIRIPASTGAWYTFMINSSGPYSLSAANPVLQLITPFIDPGVPPPAVIAHDTSSTFSSCEIDFGSEAMPFHQPIPLPSGVVIDVANSSPAASGDVMFSPRGSVTGPAVAGGPIYLLLRDVRDIGTNPTDTTVQQRDMLIVAIFPQTGHCQCYPVDVTDSDADGTADNLFRFARLGSGSGG